MQELWKPGNQRLLEIPNLDILSVTKLEIPDPSHIFYIKKDWSQDGMGAVQM